MKRVIAVGLVVLAGAAGFVACGDDDESQATAEQNLCGSLSSFSAAVVNLQGLDVQTASKDDYDEAVSQVQDAWDDVRNDAEEVRDADSAALESANEDLSNAVEDAPQDVPVADAVASLQPQVQQVSQAWREMFNGLGCTTGTSQDGTGQ